MVKMPTPNNERMNHRPNEEKKSEKKYQTYMINPFQIHTAFANTKLN